MISQNQMNKKFLKILYVITFFLSTAYAFTAYINSTYLENFVPPQFVGLIFSVAALLSVIGLSEIPKLLSKKGNYKVSFWLLAFLILSLLGLALFKSAFLVVFTFVIYIILSYLFVLTRDIFIESYSDEQATGKIRGTF